MAHITQENINYVCAFAEAGYPVADWLVSTTATKWDDDKLAHLKEFFANVKNANRMSSHFAGALDNLLHLFIEHKHDPQVVADTLAKLKGA